MWADERKPNVKYQNIYTELAEDLIAIAGETFTVLLCLRLLTRSPELPTTATPQDLFGDVCETFVRDNFAKLVAFRTKKFGACHMTGVEVAAIAEALQPLCVRVFPTLNVMLAEDRDNLFRPCDYIAATGKLYYEEAPVVTFTRYLNDMQRFKDISSEIYERNVPRIAQVHALNRVAKIMPKEANVGWSGKLKPGQTIDAAKWAEREATWAWFRSHTGIRSVEDLLARAGQA